MKYVQPRRDSKLFTCPHCGVLATQQHRSSDETLSYFESYSDAQMIGVTTCDACGDSALWHFRSLVFPRRGMISPPDPYLPGEVETDYLQAAAIVDVSPGAAAALLRLGLKKLCVFLGCDGKSLTSDFQYLVDSRCLPAAILTPLTEHRVIGRRAVRPGLISNDGAEVAKDLFALTNLIAVSMIAIPSQIDEVG